MLSLLLLLGCGREASAELSQAWQIDRLRVLGIAGAVEGEEGEAGTIAEPRPGQTVAFSSLVVSPEDTPVVSLWTLCLEASDYGCSVDPALLEQLEGIEDPSSLTPDELGALAQQLEAAGVIGVDPLLSPRWSVPSDVLDGLEGAAREEGLNATVTISAFPTPDDGSSLEDADVEVVFKRLPISEAVTPNHNPALLRFQVDGVDVPEGARVWLNRGEAYTITPVLSSAAVEDYTYTTADGTVETRTEQPYFNWYLQEGTFEQPFTLYPETGVVYIAPDDPALSEQTIWAVVRDRRGGMGWLSLSIGFR